jgi:hypothetical protein
MTSKLISTDNTKNGKELEFSYSHQRSKQASSAHSKLGGDETFSSTYLQRLRV